MKNDYNRRITLICPTCAADQLEHDEDVDSSIRVYTCLDCGRKLSHDELLKENGGRVESAIGELKTEIIGDIKKDFSKLFK